MKPQTKILVILIALLAFLAEAAPLGTAFMYQGQLKNGTNLASGEHDITFALFDAPFGTNRLGFLEFIEEDIIDGALVLPLDFGPTAFDGQARWLEISVRRNDSGDPYTRLIPRQQVFPTPYSLLAGTVLDRAITSNKLAIGAVTSSNLAPGSVTSPALSRFLTLGAPNLAGRLDIYSDNAPLAIRLDGDAPSISTYGSDGLAKAWLSTPLNGGELLLFDRLTNDMTVRLSSGAAPTGDLGGLLELFSSSSALGPSRRQVNLNSGFNGGQLELYSRSGNRTFLLDGGVGEMEIGRTDGPFVRLGAGFGLGIALLSLHAPNGSPRVDVRANAAGEFHLFDQGGFDTLTLRAGAQPDANSGGSLFLRQPNGQNGVMLYANGPGGLNPGGLMRVFQSNGLDSISLVGNANQISIINDSARESARWSGPSYGELLLRDGTPANNTGARLHSQPSFSGLELRNAGVLKAHFVADPVSGGLALYNGANALSILLDGAQGKTTTKVLQITGGADLSEQFDVGSRDDVVSSGMVVCIDPENPGKLVMSTKEYDRTVAGIVSGAGGVSPGMLMGHQGTAADGKHPVALTGRVYCLADAESGAIRPGDLLTTSDTPGHAMKVKEHAKAQGAIIGKAMTGLSSDRGLVLVLVSLQ